MKVAARSSLCRVPRGPFTGLLIMVALAWVVEILDTITPLPLDPWMGIVPRTLEHLPQIISTSWAHGGFGHLIANTVPWLVLGTMTMVGERKAFFKTTAVLIVLAGLGTWLIGRNALHIGASGLVYGSLATFWGVPSSVGLL